MFFSGHDEGKDNLFNADAGIAEEQQNKAFSYGGNVGQTNKNYSPDAGDYNLYVPGTSGADQASARYQNMGLGLANRDAYKIDYGAANANAAQGQGARGSQMDALGLQQQAAYGAAPSVAQQQMQQGMDRASASQQSMAASARGPAALALAQQQAAGNVANLQQQNNTQQGILRAGEMAQARDAYMGGSSAIRGQDYTAQGLNAQQAQAQGQQEIAQRALNQQGQLSYEQMGAGVQQQQLNANMQQKALQEGHWAGQSALDQHATDRDRNDTMGAVNAVGSLFSGGLGSDPRSKMDMQPLSRQAPMGSREPWLPPNSFPNYALISDPSAKQDARFEGMIAGAQAIKKQMAMAYGAPSPVTGGADARSAPMGGNPDGFDGTINRRNPYGPSRDEQIAQMTQDYAHNFAAVHGNRPQGATEPERMANSMEPISYEYRHEPGQRRYGITTEQLKQTPMGASLVERDPRSGYEAVNVPQATGASFAMHADQQDQINQLKAQIAGMRDQPMRAQPALDRDAMGGRTETTEAGHVGPTSMMGFPGVPQQRRVPTEKDWEDHRKLHNEYLRQKERDERPRPDPNYDPTDDEPYYENNGMLVAPWEYASVTRKSSKAGA